MTTYTHEGQQRLLKLINTLAGNEVTGLAPAVIAKLQGCDKSLVTRDLANLREAGYAEQVPETGCWRLGPQLVQIALKHMHAIDQAEQRLEQIRNRFSRS